jgi:hypothetical protein
LDPIHQVEREVDLVLIADHMVESMVILRRALGLDATALHNDLAMLVGINGHLSKSPMSPDDAKVLCHIRTRTHTLQIYSPYPPIGTMSHPYPY